MNANQQVMVKSIRGLTPDQIANLKWHAEQGTPICCGDESELYTDGKGGG